MRTISSSELRIRLGRYLALVCKGETIAVTYRGIVVALIVPLTSKEKKTHAAMGKPTSKKILRGPR
jgi:antitoxin (DNA-binding transcriptional repressor) of toxin-antitoxin stability system